MLSPRRKQSIQQKSTGTSVAAPVGGWNARDSWAAMDPLDAVVLTNWFPGTTSVNMRNGYTQHATGLSGQVESLLVWNGAASSKMFGFAGTQAYEVTSAGAVGAAVLTAMTNARWQYINMSTTAGNYIMAVNGADKLKFYNGTAWAKDGDGGGYDITGVDTATIKQINLHKNRVWLVNDGTLDAYYLATSARAGAATKFTLNGIARLGGYIVAMATWTMDAGNGADDMAAFITSEGEVIVYRGTDPASSATWALVGVWVVGQPVGTRCYAKYAGDVLIITQDGVVPLSLALQSTRLNARIAITDKIQAAVSSAVSSYGSSFGWEITVFPKANQLYLNVPIAGTSQEQYVMNTISKAWCNFTDWSANCFAILDDNLYFGGNTFVAAAWSGLTDGGDAITFAGVQAFNYFKDTTYKKIFKLMKPLLLTNGAAQLSGNINVDFDTSTTGGPLSTATPPYSLWDVALWDVGLWGIDLSPQQIWQGVNGVGYCGAPVLTGSSSGIQVHWQATTVVWERAKGTML